MVKTAEKTKVQDGKIIAIVGVVVDVEFAGAKKLPAIYDALHVEYKGRTITLEVRSTLTSTLYVQLPYRVPMV